MTQNRKPPAYQEYAAALLVNKQFRCMSLAERGLLYSLRLECWENNEVPANDNELARYLGFEINELKCALTTRVKSFFTESNGVYTSPELDDYRQHLNERKSKQSEGGKKGAAKTNERKQSQTSDNAGENGGRVPRRGSRELTRESLVQYSSAQLSKTQPLENGGIVKDEWVNDYDRASNG